MACKSCKKNNTNILNGLLGTPKGKFFKNNMKSSLLDNGIGGSHTGEKIVLVFFAWIPLFVGYYTTIKFLISLF